MKKLISLYLLLALTSCLDEPEYYHSKFYPVGWLDNSWKKNEIIDDKGISIKLESRLNYEDDPSSISGEFEPLDFDNTRFYLDRDLYYPDTILKGSNLLNYDISEVETLQSNSESNSEDDNYIFWINRIQNSDFNLFNNGYFTVYLESVTKNGYLIRDSTVVFIE